MASDRDEQKRVASAGEYLLNEARYGVQDIRQKLFEEAWFGRVVTPAPVIEARLPDKEVASEPERRPRFEDVWGSPSGRTEQDERAKGGHEPDIER
jgi:hypothetical protein